MPLPGFRLPMASTSSLEFFGLTLSCCWTGCCWLGWVCSEGGATLAGLASAADFALARCSLPTPLKVSVYWLVGESLACHHLRLSRVYTQTPDGLLMIPQRLRCSLRCEGFLPILRARLIFEVSCAGSPFPRAAAIPQSAAASAPARTTNSNNLHRRDYSPRGSAVPFNSC